MRKLITLLIPFCVLVATAQSSFNYQAVVKDSGGNALLNATVDLQFIIYEGAALTNNVYQETHASVTTDANGLIAVGIGEGTTTDNFNTIDWGADEHFLNIQINTGTGLSDLGTVTLRTVPYAQHAFNVKGLEDLDEGNGIGWRLIGREPDNFGNIGFNAVDLSQSSAISTTRGATGQNAVALGFDTTASGNRSTAMGSITVASGFRSTAMGNGSVASNVQATAMGSMTAASGFSATAMGGFTEASGDYSTAMGLETQAQSYSSTAIGRYNIGGGDPTNWVETNPLFEIGNGSSDASRSNALTILKNGIIRAPSLDLSEVNDNKSLTTKEYVDSEIAGLSLEINDLEDARHINNDSSVFLGEGTGASDDGTDNRNVAVGIKVLENSITSEDNTGMGAFALFMNDTGSRNTVLGSQALFTNSSGSENTAIGYNALYTNALGWRNTAVGFQALQSNISASLNTAIGYMSLNANTSGVNNVAIGANALRDNLAAGDNTAVGIASLQENESGTSNTAIGASALQFSTTSENVAVGAFSMQQNISGINNVAIGYNSMKNSTNSSNSIAIGHGAMMNITGSANNIAIGIDALASGNLASRNIALGNHALQNSTSGFENAAFGDFALFNNIDGNRNVALGRSTLIKNESGENNVAIGYNALGNNVDGNVNIAIGSNALSGVTGTNNIGIGSGTSVPNASGNGQIRLGNSGISYAGVQVPWTITSDIRWKEKVRDLPYGLDFLDQLRPVDYVRKNNDQKTREIGLIAQEVQQTLSDINYTDQGMLTADDEGYLSLRYNDLIPVIIKAIKELKTENEELKETIQELKKQL